MLPRLKYFAPGEARSQAQSILLAALKTMQEASLVAAHPDPSTGTETVAHLRCGRWHSCTY